MKTPEIGDVWKDVDDQVLIHIISKNIDNSFDILVSDTKEVWDVKDWQLNEYYTYVGKAKSRVEQLFEIEEK